MSKNGDKTDKPDTKADTDGGGYRAVKISTAGYERLCALMERVSRNGWISVGADRGDKLTHANVLDEALVALGERKAKK